MLFPERKWQQMSRLACYLPPLTYSFHDGRMWSLLNMKAVSIPVAAILSLHTVESLKLLQTK